MDFIRERAKATSFPFKRNNTRRLNEKAQIKGNISYEEKSAATLGTEASQSFIPK
tara:strand:+ start:496 stop:660 length:165 start_codon:yes stop_codon:yes gene_type:complete